MTTTATRRPATLPLSLSEPAVTVNRFPSPPPVPMPPFTFPLADSSTSQLAELDSKHFSFVNGDALPRPSGSRSSSRKSSISGAWEEESLATPKMHMRVSSRIIVPAITLTPPQAPTAYPILKSYSIDNPFLPKETSGRPAFPSRPSLLNFATFSPSKRLRRKTSRRMSDEEEAGETVNELSLPRVQKPKRSFSLPSSINTALDWALSTSTSAPSSPTKQYAKSVAELEKIKSQAPDSGFSLPQILPTSTSSLFSPPPSSNGVFSFNNLPSREKKAVPAYTARRRANKSPLVILLFPLLVVALHIYFSFVDVRFMHLGHDLVFGSPMAHRHTYAEGLHLDMHDAWDQFEEKISFAKRESAVVPAHENDASDEPELDDPESSTDNDSDVIAFLRSMQEAADRSVASS
ncbi:hypothetical protein HD553DRAFT_49537 [Filobasidium floriforme]|uniref:uncharacterized protein n=1 Tax=Filobasidium floriforme TaxID=5210 RepID=UPI001E8D6D68|nr:uncharacterized protein HD553DRAFT_49537 [Filobasidium floriforme]KAH8083634.1 hypothetical protein HD553DRAFT_49537 [Filobasidium floriforme]